MPENHQASKKRLTDSKYLKYSGLAFQLLAALLLGMLAGKKLDNYFNTEPYLLAICLLFGLAAGMYLVIKDLFRK